MNQKLLNFRTKIHKKKKHGQVESDTHFNCCLHLVFAHVYIFHFVIDSILIFLKTCTILSKKCIYINFFNCNKVYFFTSSESRSSRSFFLASLPLKIAVLNNLQYNSIEDELSSLPGTGYVMMVGSELVSTIPIVGMFALADSKTNTEVFRTVSKVLRKMTKSGNLMVDRNVSLVFVKSPGLRFLQCANSWQSMAVCSIIRQC